MATNCFTNLWQETPLILSDTLVEAVNIESCFSTQHGKKGHYLTARCYDLKSKGAQCRMVQISSEKTSILNTMIFPLNATIPTFAAELLRFGKRWVAFIDIQTPGLPNKQLQNFTTEVEKISAKYSKIPRLQAPSWATEYSTQKYIFTRFEDSQYQSNLNDAYCDYLNLWIVLCNRFTSDHTTMMDKQLLEYKKHHVQNSPGTKFMSTIFGKDWSHSFLHDFLYR